MLIDLLSHLSEQEKKQVEQLDNEIYELQGNCTSGEDVELLNHLYAKRSKIIKEGGMKS